MKNIFITMMGLLVVVACNQRPHSSSADMDGEDEELAYSSGSDRQADDADTLQVKQLEYSYEVEKVSVGLTIDWPQAGGSRHLLNAIRELINEQLGGSFSSALGDGQQLTTYYGDSLRDALKQAYAEEKQNVDDEDYINGFSHTFTFKKVFETPRLVSYLVSEDVYLDGAHGMQYCHGVSFRKTDGRRFGYDMMRNLYTPDMYQLLKDGLKQYFSAVGQQVTSDDELKEFILTDDDVNSLPLPRYAPYFTDKGLVFTYQPYEISFYAAGMPEFEVPVSVAMPFFTNTALQLFAE